MFLQLELVQHEDAEYRQVMHMKVNQESMLCSGKFGEIV